MTRLRAEVEGAGTGVRFVVNAHAEDGQLSSTIAGLNAADRPGVHARDGDAGRHPAHPARHGARAPDDFATRRALIVRATYHGRHGHPVIFGRGVFDALRHADPAIGAKAVLRAQAAGVVDVEVDDPGVLHDIDEPGDYARVFNQPI